MSINVPQTEFSNVKNKSQLCPQHIIQIFYSGQLDQELNEKPFIKQYVQEMFKIDEINDVEQNLLAKFSNFHQFLQVIWVFLTDEKTQKLLQLSESQSKQIIDLLIENIQKPENKNDTNQILLVTDVLSYFLKDLEDYIVEQIIGIFQDQQDKNQTGFVKNQIPSKNLLAMQIYDGIYPKLSKNNELMFHQYATYILLNQSQKTLEGKLCYTFMKRFKNKGLNQDWLKKYQIDQIDLEQQLGLNNDEDESIEEMMKRLFSDFKTKKFQNKILISRLSKRFIKQSDRQEILRILYAEMEKDQNNLHKQKLLTEFLHHILENYNFQQLYNNKNQYQLKLIEYIHKQQQLCDQHLQENEQVQTKFVQKSVELANKIKEQCLEILSKIYHQNGDICLQFLDEQHAKKIQEQKKHEPNQVIKPVDPQQKYDIDSKFFNLTENYKGGENFREENIQKALNCFLIKNNSSLFTGLVECIRYQNDKIEDQDFFFDMIGDCVYKYYLVQNELVQKRVRDLLKYIENQKEELKLQKKHFKNTYNTLRAEGQIIQKNQDKNEKKVLNVDNQCSDIVYEILNLKFSINELSQNLINAYENEEFQQKIWPALFKALKLGKNNIVTLEKVMLQFILEIVKNYGIYSFTQYQLKILDFISEQTYHQQQKYRDMALEAFVEYYKQVGEVIYLFTQKVKPQILKRFHEITENYNLQKIQLKKQNNQILPYIEEKKYQRYFENENKNYFDFQETDKNQVEIANQLIKDALLLFIVKNNTDLLHFIKKQLLQLNNNQKVEKGLNMLFNQSIEFLNNHNQLIKKRAIQIFHYLQENYSSKNLQIYSKNNLNALITQIFKMMRISYHSEIYAEDFFELQKELIQNRIITLQELQCYLEHINYNQKLQFSYLDILINLIISTCVQNDEKIQSTESFKNQLKQSIKYVKNQILTINELKDDKEAQKSKAFNRYKNGSIKTQFINVLAFILVVLSEDYDIKDYIEKDLTKFDISNLNNKVQFYKLKHKDLTAV
ncbi:hypothetical protein PPERSA_06534 [Pseudocohnilembus persalinus]|uniref:Uncharacterized protein n=1 Tax=Pseudocohnilembus persalinus TaxID=266149 RepID=A0A0V0QRP3_PSEPJ|nr:hypothetical protein PPERSA_06534 [Pseudocohnilembus persalinus]|eukprot:KRX04900.1 hypothetical protein PPERSA_06534 [Pseudocohnilembus persalinus]